MITQTGVRLLSWKRTRSLWVAPARASSGTDVEVLDDEVIALHPAVFHGDRAAVGPIHK